MSRKIEPIEVKDFISQLVNEIEQGVDIEQRDILGTIDIEVSVENVINKQGGLKVYVASGSTGASAGQIAKAKFSVYPKPSERSKDQIEEIRIHNEDANRKWGEWSR